MTSGTEYPLALQPQGIYLVPRNEIWQGQTFVLHGSLLLRRQGFSQFSIFYFSWDSSWDKSKISPQNGPILQKSCFIIFSFLSYNFNNKFRNRFVPRNNLLYIIWKNGPLFPKWAHFTENWVDLSQICPVFKFCR